jgi:integrating conjugative element protein (TIGR03759 family)
MLTYQNKTQVTRYAQAVVFTACFCALLSASPSHAASRPTTHPTIQTSIEAQNFVSPQHISRNQTARAWGLSPEEWTRYQTVMQGPRGIYSPGLDPLTALGIEAESAEERVRYAEMQVKAERQRIDKELAYQRAYDQAFSRLYPDEKVIQISSSASSPVTIKPVLSSTGRLAVFVQDNCTPCIAKVKDLQKQKTAFDLYFVGSQKDDERIRRWAIVAGIDPAAVRSRRITLNHDEGQWQKLDVGGELPALVREVGGKWQRQ